MWNKGEIRRLDEEDLREIYLDSKRVEKRMSVFYMVLSGISTSGILCYAIIKEIYWVCSLAIISVIAFIYLISQFSQIIEEIFENRIYEEEGPDGEEEPS